MGGAHGFAMLPKRCPAFLGQQTQEFLVETGRLLLLAAVFLRLPVRVHPVEAGGDEFAEVVEEIRVIGTRATKGERARGCNYENGKREPNLETVLRLADLFGVTTDWLLGREGPAEARETISGYGEPVVNRATSLSGGTFRPRFGAIILAAIRSSKSG